MDIHPRFAARTTNKVLISKLSAAVLWLERSRRHAPCSPPSHAMSADAKALRLFGVARDSIEASAAATGQPEPEPVEPQPERPPCEHGRARVLASVLALGFFLTLFWYTTIRW
jgi:hypothetical protein